MRISLAQNSLESGCSHESLQQLNLAGKPVTEKFHKKEKYL
jgi:hypothetical protein